MRLFDLFSRLILVAFAASISLPAAARVFSYQDTFFSAYVRGTGGLTSIGDDTYAKTSGSSTLFNQDVKYDFTGEVGFALQMNPHFTLRIGAEGIQTKSLTANGDDANSNSLMSVNNKVTAFNPNISGEMAFAGAGNARFYLLGGLGYATVKVSNQYSLTAAGIADYAGSTSAMEEDWYGTAITYLAGAGAELYVFDNVTMSLEAGWRQMQVYSFYYNSNTTVIRGTGTMAVNKGAPVTDNGGTNRVQMDLSGPFVGIKFRFYIPPLN